MKPVCLVLGAGAGIGGTVGQKFASEGYHAVLARRSDQDGLDRIRGVQRPQAEGEVVLARAVLDAARRGLGSDADLLTGKTFEYHKE